MGARELLILVRHHVMTGPEHLAAHLEALLAPPAAPEEIPLEWLAEASAPTVASDYGDVSQSVVDALLARSAS